MATVKLGQLISNIAGTVGNVTFRRFKNGHIAQVKTLGASKAQLLQNNALSGFADAVRYWNLVSASERSAWNSAAALHQFPDKFGDLKYLSGRQLFIKCHVNVKAVGSPQIFVSGFNTNVDSVFLETDEITLNGTNEIYPDSTANQGYCLIQAVLMKNNVIKPDYKRHEIAAWFDWGLTDHVSIGQYLLNKYPYLKVGDTVMLYATNMNPYGIRSNTEAIRASVIGLATAWAVVFTPAQEAYILQDLSVTLSSITVQCTMYIADLAAARGVYGSGAYGTYIASDGSLVMRTSAGTFTSPAPVGFPIGQEFTFGLQYSNGVANILVNGIIKMSMSVTGLTRVYYIGRHLNYYFSGYMKNFSYNTVYYSFDEHQGTTVTASNSQTGTLTALNGGANMWQQV